MSETDEERVTYTKEEIESRVRVPAVVEVELKHVVEDRLKQCGLYYLIFSRVKAADSLARKYQLKQYNGEKKIQDLIGLRIDLYFEDDLSICRSILEKTFVLVEWAESENNEDEFRSTKINGVFRLPEYLKRQITDDTWDMCIDDTVEIQLKTVFFEGWHEIEHDMRYKGGELWSGKGSYIRYFNSILATLELCDKSVVSLFENLGHDLYKEHNWSGMMKVHYRLKMEDRPLYPEVEQILDGDESENNPGKQLFKTSREVLVDELLKQPRRIPINVNTIVALVNQAVIHDDRLSRIFYEHDVFDDGNEPMGEDNTFGRLEPLCKVPVFNATVNLSTYKYSKHEGCKEAARLTYAWIYDKYGHLEGELPHELKTFDLNMLGYRISVVYEPERDYWKMETTQIDMDAPGQVWVTEAECYPSDDGRQMLSVRNSYAAVEEKRGYLNRYFSCPKFYSSISDRIGLFDVRYLSTSRRIIKDRDIGKIRNLILSTDRTLPVCLIISEDQGGGWLNEGWLENFRVYDFTRMAGRYTHIYTAAMYTGQDLLGPLGIVLEEPSVIIFKSAAASYGGDIVGSRLVYTRADVEECLFGRRQIKQEGQHYDIVRGGQAFYHKLLTEVRNEMTNS